MSKVYFTDMRTSFTENLPKKLTRLIDRAGLGTIDFDHKFVAIKIHFGEMGNLAYLRPQYARALAAYIKERGGLPFLTDCNTLYVGSRKNALEHIETAYINGYTPYATGCQVIIADGVRGTDEAYIPIGCAEVKTAKIGRAIADADIIISLNHFKGHEDAGFGGALKQLSIGCASSYGKAYIHGAGEPEKIGTADHDSFLDAMADAASSVAEYFKDKTVFINVMKNMSVDCDCCAVAEDPCMADIGILASLDPIAVDQACLDLVYASDDPGRDHLVERIESLNGVRTVESAAALGFGTREYELVEL